MRIRSALLGIVLAPLSLPAPAQWLSWPPRAQATPAPAPAATQVPVRLRLEAGASGYGVWVENDLHGPVEVRLHRDGDAGRPTWQRLLPGPGRHLIGQLPAGRQRLQLVALPGAPGARAADVRYRFPLQGVPVRIGQLPHGDFSHRDAENRDAIDFVAAIGTPVIAARAGVVMHSEDRFSDAPGGARDAVNQIRIRHEDGSMAVYAHLAQASSRVRPGQAVAVGQIIAASGNSGYSSGPHLHFVVQVNAGMQLHSVPVRIETDEGELQLPRVLP